jgi:hypothetical protein
MLLKPIKPSETEQLLTNSLVIFECIYVSFVQVFKLHRDSRIKLPCYESVNILLVWGSSLGCLWFTTGVE